jgi:hypothetical protein
LVLASSLSVAVRIPSHINKVSNCLRVSEIFSASEKTVLIVRFLKYFYF